MKKEGFTRINTLRGLAFWVLFLTSYLPLFFLIIVSQTYSSFDYLYLVSLIHRQGTIISCDNEILLND